METSLTVAVIDAGLAGLTAARELQRESHQVVVFEKSHRLGGTWAYDPQVESDLLEKVYHDPQKFPSHDEVLKFLEDFACSFELTKLIRFNTMVTKVEVLDSGITQFVVELNTDGVHSVEVFDAVVVCNGHNSEPQLTTDIPRTVRKSG
ncbi:unnamed protein product [Lactuca virosa]|uniref:Flavin-containing monooxygenase n=1 Tax=Lactuca virosa TaxID=75947 RepID=A0AAU9PCZ3_9ASTR|nr:unnamed protein product [Lactuca virosa]